MRFAYPGYAAAQYQMAVGRPAGSGSTGDGNEPARLLAMRSALQSVTSTEHVIGTCLPRRHAAHLRHHSVPAEHAGKQIPPDLCAGEAPM